MSLIAVDIDDTLYSFADAAREECIRRHDASEDGEVRRAYGSVAYLPWTSWRVPPDLLGRNKWMNVIEAVHQTDVILSREPYANSVQVINELYDEGHQIDYVSSRHDRTVKATKAWLIEKGFPLDGRSRLEAHTDNGPAARYLETGYTDDKAALLKWHSCLIDDRCKSLVEFVFTPAAEAHFGFGLQKDFNHNLTDIPGIYISPTWMGLRAGLVSKGFLS